MTKVSFGWEQCYSKYDGLSNTTDQVLTHINGNKVKRV